MAKAFLFCVITVGFLFGIVNPMGPWPYPPSFCDPTTFMLQYSLATDVYSEAVGTGIGYFCPAHTVNNRNWRRSGAGIGCGTQAQYPIAKKSASNVNCTSSNSTASNTTVSGTNGTADCGNVTVSNTTEPLKNKTYSSLWRGGGACVVATCLPPCASGATCYCGKICRCQCPLGFTGADCSINTATIPNFASAKVFYAFSDPHWTFFPTVSPNPWVLDLTGNGLHGEIHDWVGLDPNPGPTGKTHSSFIFGTNWNAPGYITINNASFDLSQLVLQPNASKYTILTYYKPYRQGNNETLLFNFAKSGSTLGTTIATTLKQPTFYYDDSVNNYTRIVGNNYETSLPNTSYSLLHFEIDTNSPGSFNYETGTTTVQSTALGGSLAGANNHGIFIGKNTNPSSAIAPLQIYLQGNLAALFINNQTGLGNSHVASYQNFTATNFGVGQASFFIENTYTPCPVMPPSQALPTRIIVNASIGDTVEHICPPFYTFVVIYWPPGGGDPYPISTARTWSVTCDVNGWNGTSGCGPDPAPIFCDPICINGGTCMCTLHLCWCQCWPGFTGPDCFAPTSAIPTNFIAFWPMSKETLAGDTNGILYAADFSNNGWPIAMQNMGFDEGPWGADLTAVRQHYLRANSYMYMDFPFLLNGTQDFTILFYIKLPHRANSLPGRASLPLFVYSATEGANKTDHTGFFLDESNGTIIYYPGGIYLTHIGDPLTKNATEVWVPVKIAYSAATGCMGTASWDATPVMNTSVTIEAVNATFYFGYDDVLDRVSDMSLTCVGFYDAYYTDMLTWDHGRVCQMFSKQQCVSAPMPDTTAVQSASAMYSGNVVTYTCFNGMVWNSSSSMTLSFGCNPNHSMYPTLNWDVSTLPGVCEPDPGVCHPTCQHGGTCVLTITTATCLCPTGYIGLDCSIPTNIFPSFCNLVSFWPLISTQITSDGFAADLVGPNPASVDRTSIFFPDNFGPYAAVGAIGVAQLTYSLPGTVQVSPATSPFPSGSSFMVGAFVRFDITAGTNYSDLYPLIAFTNRGVSNSPAILISPMGNGQFNYKSATNAYSASFDSGGMFIGIAAAWAYVAVQYDVTAGTIAMSVNGSVFGTAVAVTPTPMFSTRTMYIGSIDSGLVWPGEITCLSIYNWVLTNAQLLQLMAACQQVLGGSAVAAAPAGCNACSGIQLPPGGLALSLRNDVVMPFGTVVTYRSPPNTMFAGTTSSRSTTSMCSASGAWSPLSILNVTTTGLITCDPPCLNYGRCLCTTTACSCLCPSGYTGADCVIATSNLPAAASAFWPLTGDTIAISSNKLVALDFSGNGNNLVIGSNVALETGIYSTPYSAFRFRNGQLSSYLASMVPLNFLSAGSPFTILFYMKYNPASDNQPLVAYASAGESQRTEFWADQSTGYIQYYPDNTLLELSGTDLGNQAGLVWLPVNIATMNGSPLNVGTSTYDTLPINLTLISTVSSSGKLYVGYSDYNAPVTADISIFCLGIYQSSYSQALASQHGKACQIFAKQYCPNTQGPPTSSYKSAVSIYPAATVYYFCWSGYYWATNGQQQFSQTCLQSNNTVQPALFFSTAPPGSCTASTTTTCYPQCLNGGTCISGTPTSTCSCASGFGGLDCSINLATLPYICKLTNLWPLTTSQIDNTGKAYDIGSQHQSLSLTSAILWPKDIGLYATFNNGIASFVSAPAGAAQVTMAATAAPFLSQTSFTISAYVSFDASATYTTLYPIVSFANAWTYPSPAIYLSASGNLVMLFKSGSSSYSVAFSVPQLIALQPWAFITVRYDAQLGKVDATLNGNQTGSAVTVSPTPMFSTKKVYIGSSDTTPGGGSAQLKGQLACVSIYATALTAAEIIQLKLACDTILGGSSAPLATTTCYTCNEPPSGGLAMKTVQSLTFLPNTVATYTAPAFSRYPAPNMYRTMMSSCTANLTWSPVSLPAVDSPITPPVMCDPECRNGGLCQCTGTICKCNCLTGFTGIDCAVATSYLTAGVMALWPLTSDSTGRDALGNLFAYDLSGLGNNLKVGSAVLLENGPFSGTIKSAFRFRSQIANAFLSSYPTSVALSGSFTIALYVKYNSKQGGHQPLLSWLQPNSQIWISSATGRVLYYPGGLNVANNGSTFIGQPDTWIPLFISYNSTTLQIGSATFDNIPSIATAITAPSTTANFSMGYSDVTVPVTLSDVTMACVGLYQGVAYSSTLAGNHGRLCQQLAKPQCTSAPAPTLASSAFTSNPTGTVYVGESVTYICFGGYVWSSTLSQTQSVTCSSVNTVYNSLPQLAWSSATLSGSCQESTSTCAPTCISGTCMPGSPTATCLCSSGFGGVDCSIDLSKLPQRCYLVSLWPLTVSQINNLGQAADIMRSTATSGASLPTATISFTGGVADFTATSVGSISVPVPYPWPPLSSFTISAFVRFSSSASYDLLYPLFGYTASAGLSDSPGIYISPTGAVRLYLVASEMSYQLNMTAPLIGLGPWAFVSLVYNSTADTVALSVFAPPNAPAYGTPVKLSFLPVSGTMNPIYIGSTDMAPPSDSAAVFAGQIGCLSIYKTALATADLAQLMAMCQFVIGIGPAPSSATQCNVCSSIPYVSLALPSTNNETIAAGTSVTYKCPAFTGQSPPSADRSSAITCLGNEVWQPSSPASCDTSVSPRTCDPACLNGGTCRCTNSSCACYCLSGYTGVNCLMPLGFIPSSAVAFWPLTSDMAVVDSKQTATPLAADMSGNNGGLSVGQHAGLDSGPFGPGSAFRFRSSFANSYLSSSLSLKKNQPFTILFYIKYNQEAFGNQPIFAFLNGGTSFWIDQLSSKVRYYPDDVLLPFNGPSLASAPNTWMPAAIAFTPPNIFGLSSFGNLLNATATVTTVAVNGTFALGYSDNPVNTVSDLSISCVGIYANTSYSVSLAYIHAQACQRVAMQSCSGPPTVTNTFSSSSSALAGSQLTYTCIGAGYYFETANATTTVTTCAQAASSLTPSISWSPSTINDTCVKSNSICYPSCKNNGNCTAGTCICQPGYAGIDCSLAIEILTCQSHLQSLWPLTTRQVNSFGRVVDVWSLQATTSLLTGSSSTIFSAYDGPYSTNDFGLFRLTPSVPGTLMVSSPNWPSMSTNGTFFISAYVRFDESAPSSTLFPFVTFSNVSGTVGSPALFISKSGLGRMYYLSADGQPQQVDFSVPAPNVIGTATPLSFVRIEYDWESGNISITTLDYVTSKLVYGDPVPVFPEPSFVPGAAMYIGSTDMMGLSGCGEVFPGEIACLAIYNHTLPDYQTKQVVSACWDMLGGPAASVATQICTKIPYCSAPPKVINATLGDIVMAPPAPGQVLVSGMYTEQSTAYYVCDFNHAFVNDTVVDMNATCEWGQWLMPYPFCAGTLLQKNLLSLQVFVELPDMALLKYVDQYSDITLQTAWRIGNLSSQGNVTAYAIDAVAAVADVFERYAQMAENLTSSEILKLSKSCASAMGTLMFAMTNTTQMQSAVALEVLRAKNCSDVNGDSLAGTTTLAPISGEGQLTSDQLAKQFALFSKMIGTLAKLVETALQTGSEFSVDEKYFSARIRKVQLKQLTGFFLNSSLASVQFPSTSGFIIESSSMSDTEIVSIVLMAFIDNIYDISKPFNIPTISIHVYRSKDLKELTLNPSHNLGITTRPIFFKALMYSSEKMDVQCDVSTITCDLQSNAEFLGSLVRIPMSPSTGDFFLTVPTTDWAYDIYISVDSLPTPYNYTWHGRVNKDGSVAFDSSDKVNSTQLSSATYDKAIGLSVVVPQSIILQFISEQSKSFMNVFLKKDTSGFDQVQDLPASLCELQHAYGYYVIFGNATHTALSLMSASRKRRSVDSVQQSNSTTKLSLKPDSSESAIKFKSSYFGDLGADLVITPNTIEFSDIFTRFASLIADNYAVLAFQILAIVVLLGGIVVAHYYDKKDLESWAFLPIVNNQPYEKVNYYISVLYHSCKHHDLVPLVSIRLIGSLSDTARRLLKDGVRENAFYSGRPANFIMSSHHWIGHIDQIEILVDSHFEDKKPLSIHIDKVFVVDANAGKKYMFPIKKKMLAGQSHRSILASEDDVKSFRYLVTGHVRSGITESHPWLSIAKRPLPSHWTRVERLACVVSALFMAMLVNAMFYGKDATSPRVGIQIAGFIRISWFTVWTSLVGSLIIVPPTVAIGFIFKKIKRQSAEKSNTLTTFNLGKEVNELADSNSDDSKREPAKKEKKPFQLPYKCVFAAWFLVVACIGCSSFFIVMYSLSWGREKSLQWLTGIIMHIVQDVIVIQTVKVVIISVVSSTLLHLPDDGLQVGKMAYHPNNQKHQTELFAKMRNTMVGIVHHIVYVIVLSMVISTTQNSFAYQQVKDLRPLILMNGTSPLNDTVNDHSEVFSWLTKKLAPNFLSANLLSQRLNFKQSNIYQIKNHDVVLVGPMRLRQQRVGYAPCQLEKSVLPKYATKYAVTLGASIMKCQQQYSSPVDIGTSSEKRSFNMSWQQPLDPSMADALAATADSYELPWTYRSTDGPPFAGWQATYNTGGYYIDLPLDLNQSLAIINSLWAARWLDNSTTVLFVEFTLFNVQTNIFATVKIIFEALEAGGMAYSTRIFPLQLYQYVGANSMLVLAIQAVWIVVTFSNVYKIVRLVRKDGVRQFAKDGWNLFDFGHVLLSIAVIGLFATRIYFVITTISNMKTYKTTFVNLDNLAAWEDVMASLYGITFFMSLLLFFRNLSFNKYWSVFLATLGKGKFDLVSFVTVFTLITFMFASLGYFTLGTLFSDYQSFTDSLMTLIQNIIGVNGTFMDITASSAFAKFFCLSYSFVVLFLSVQFFMSIVNVTYGRVTTNIEKETDWDAELAGYMSSGIDDLLTKKKKEQTKGEDKTYPEFQPIGENDLATLEYFVYLVERFVNTDLTSYDDLDKEERNLVSWIDMNLKRKRQPGQQPTFMGCGIPRPKRQTEQPTLPVEQPQQQQQQKQEVPEQKQEVEKRRKSSAAERNDYWEYLTNPEIMNAQMRNEALDRIQATTHATVFAFEVENPKISTKKDSIRRVYSTDYVKKPSLDPVSM